MVRAWDSRVPHPWLFSTGIPVHLVCKEGIGRVRFMSRRTIKDKDGLCVGKFIVKDANCILYLKYCWVCGTNGKQDEHSLVRQVVAYPTTDPHLHQDRLSDGRRNLAINMALHPWLAMHSGSSWNFQRTFGPLLRFQLARWAHLVVFPLSSSVPS